ncbi:hypothetical protein Rleg4DRAFT_6175 [Rhizobium leguminosarum bv. trifolii WSM2297]|uniref:Uncharacterized protein n=1 Tax=Rhizobium leguminosarum bv. trifolii WSM2297 TaxID=754762 RepID=J0CVU7_RHILT|nr:hypothetical protein Rleg4DRAFT_5848 [Rhizobium leguminosarum bv. trifolii WSM2297]EJC84354.1 hypothetical protein Rleg4DRAFT_6175 [Rhizobium leguminosarum bv. trifolii WSM2297]
MIVVPNLDLVVLFPMTNFVWERASVPTAWGV